MSTKKRLGRGRRQNGRSAHGPPFVQLHYYVMDSAAYRALKSGPRALLLEIIRRYNGSNNGTIGLGVRQAAAALNITDKDTANVYFKALEAHGFIKAISRGGFNMKDPSSRRASEWAITWERVGDQPPTKEFMKWTPEEKCGPEKSVVRSGKSGQGRPKPSKLS